MFEDRYGSPLTTRSQSARDAYVEGLDLFLCAQVGVGARMDAAITADEAFAMPHLVHARLHTVMGRGPQARAALAEARARVQGVSAREAAMIEMIGDLMEGRGEAGYGKIRAHLRDFPRDVIAAQTCMGVFGLIGFSGKAGREAEQLAYTTSLAPHYGDDWWFLFQHAFAQLEAGQLAEAEGSITRSLDLLPNNAHAAHVRSHLYYENGETAAGLGYLKGFMEGYSPAGFMHCHVAWHVALWALEQGDVAGMWEVFDGHIAPDRPDAPPLNVMTDSAAILFRAAMAGVDVPKARYAQVSDFAAARFGKPGLPFADVHGALVHAMAGEQARLAAVVEGAAGPAGDVVRQMAEGFGALAAGAPDEAVRHLGAVMAEHERIGGSRAQRDLVEYALASALGQAGKGDEALRFLRMRRPHTALDHAVAGVTH